MKSVINFSKSWLAILLVLPAFLMFTGCNEDDGVIVIPAEDGTYIIGSATGADGLNRDFIVFQGRVEGDGFSSLVREGMVETFAYLTAGEIQVVTKAGAVETTYGGVAGQTGFISLNGENSQIFGRVDTGKIAIDGIGISIATAGFYHIVVDMTQMAYYFYKIEDFEYTDGFQTIPQVSADASGAKWEATNIVVDAAFKFRWNEGWKVIVLDGPTEADDFIFFANFGKGDTDAELRAGGGEWAVSSLAGGAGKYTITIEWVPGDGWSLDMTRTGDLDPVDYSGESLAIIGLGFNLNGVNVGWDNDAGGHLPVVSGSMHTWTYTPVSFDPANGGKFRSTGTWSGTFNLGCAELTLTGDTGAIDCSGGSDIYGTAATAGKMYTLEVKIDGLDPANPVLNIIEL